MCVPTSYDTYIGMMYKIKTFYLIVKTEIIKRAYLSSFITEYLSLYNSYFTHIIQNVFLWLLNVVEVLNLHV